MSPLSRSVRFSSAPRLVTRPTPILRGGSSSSNRRRGWNFVAQNPQCPHAALLLETVPAARAKVLPSASRVRFLTVEPRAAELSVKNLHFHIDVHFKKELAYLQCTCGPSNYAVELRLAAAESGHLLRASARFKECRSEEEMHSVH